MALFSIELAHAWLEGWLALHWLDRTVQEPASLSHVQIYTLAIVQLLMAAQCSYLSAG
jgi:hypothetical protein